MTVRPNKVSAVGVRDVKGEEYWVRCSDQLAETRRLAGSRTECRSEATLKAARVDRKPDGCGRPACGDPVKVPYPQVMA